MIHSFKYITTQLAVITILCCFVTVADGQTIVINSGRYQIDNSLHLIVCNQVPTSLTAPATSIQLDRLYTFATPVGSISTAQIYPVTYQGTIYQLSFTQFPIIAIDTKGAPVVQNVSRASSLSLTEVNGAVTSSYAGIDIHGASSAFYPKKSYNLELWEDTVSRAKKDVALLGMRSDSDWILMAMFTESLRINNVTSHALWRTMHQLYYANQEPNALSAIRTQYVDVFVNGAYAGLYALAEKMDRKQLQLKKTRDNGTVRGELYKAVDWTSAVLFMGMPVKDGNDNAWAGFELKYPNQPGFWTNMYALVESTVNWSDADFTNQVASQWQIDNLVDYFLFLNLVRATDNTAKNIYIARYKEGEPYFMTAWDLDGTWGFRYEGSRDNTTNDILSNGLFERLLRLNPANFKQKLKTRWFTLRINLLASTNLKNALANNAALLINNGAYLREGMKWGVGSVGTELAYMNTWIDNRTAFLDTYFSQLLGGTTVSLSGTVYNDANGLTDGVISGTAVSTLSGNVFSANLIGSDGKVVATTTLTNGLYSFTGVSPNTSYSIVLTNSPGTVGSASPSPVLSGGVVNTGESIGTVTGSDGMPDGRIAVIVSGSSIANINFGVDRLPSADPKTASSEPNPGGTAVVNVPTLTGSDPEDGSYLGTTLSNTLVIQSLPTNGKLYYNDVAVTTGQIIPNYDPAKLTVDPNDGPVSVTFTYSERDAAGQNSTPALVTIPFIVVSDVVPIMYARPLVVYGTTDITVVVDVVEINSVATNGLITVKVTKDQIYSLNFTKAAERVGGHTVQNNAWNFDDSQQSYYVLTTNQSIPTGGKLTFGLTGTLNPGKTTGKLSLSVVITGGSGGEVKVNNNVHSSRIEYF